MCGIQGFREKDELKHSVAFSESHGKWFIWHGGFHENHQDRSASNWHQSCLNWK